MTNPTPPSSPAGQPTLLALIEELVNIATTLEPEAAQLIANIAAALGTVGELFDPAAGKEVEREDELAADFKAKDVAALQTFYNDEPPHPNKSRAIAANYLKILGAPLTPTPAAP